MLHAGIPYLVAKNAAFGASGKADRAKRGDVKGVGRTEAMCRLG